MGPCACLQLLTDFLTLPASLPGTAGGHRCASTACRHATAWARPPFPLFTTSSACSGCPRPRQRPWAAVMHQTRRRSSGTPVACAAAAGHRVSGPSVAPAGLGWGRRRVWDGGNNLQLPAMGPGGARAAVRGPQPPSIVLGAVGTRQQRPRPGTSTSPTTERPDGAGSDQALPRAFPLGQRRLGCRMAAAGGRRPARMPSMARPAPSNPKRLADQAPPAASCWSCSPNCGANSPPRPADGRPGPVGGPGGWGRPHPPPNPRCPPVSAELRPSSLPGPRSPCHLQRRMSSWSSSCRCVSCRLRARVLVGERGAHQCKQFLLMARRL